MEFPSNSQQPIVPSTGGPPREKKEPVLKVVDEDAKVVRRKRTIGDRFKDMFLKDGKKRFETYVTEVLFPSAQDMLFDAATQALARAILGEERASKISSSTARTVTSRLVGNSPRGFVDYDRFAKKNPGFTGLSRVARAHHDFEEVILPSHRDAMRVIENMKDYADRYGAVSVGDLYDMIGEESTFADEKYGWTIEDLADARPRPVRSGFLLDMNKPQPLRIR